MRGTSYEVVVDVGEETDKAIAAAKASRYLTAGDMSDTFRQHDCEIDGTTLLGDDGDHALAIKFTTPLYSTGGDKPFIDAMTRLTDVLSVERIARNS